jgi:transcriptional regulator with XRE-family HTH domain
MNSKERLLEYLKYLGIGQNAFESNIGVSVAYISKLKGSIGSEVLAKIKRAYPELSMDWLIDEDGDMIRQNVNQTNEHGDNINTVSGNISVNKTNDENIKALKDRIYELIKERDEYKDKVIALQEKIIEIMSEKKIEK